MKIIFSPLLFLLLSFSSVFSQTDYRSNLKQKLLTAKENKEKVELLFQLSYSYLFSYANTSAAYAKQGVQLAQKINDTGDIVKAHGGELKVETKEGGGAEFIIRIPGV